MTPHQCWCVYDLKKSTSHGDKKTKDLYPSLPTDHASFHGSVKKTQAMYHRNSAPQYAVHTSVQDFAPEGNFLLPRHFTGMRIEHFDTLTPLRDSLLRDTFDHLDTLLAQDLGQFDNLTPCRNPLLRGSFDHLACFQGFPMTCEMALITWSSTICSTLRCKFWCWLEVLAALGNRTQRSESHRTPLREDRSWRVDDLLGSPSLGSM